MQNKRRIIAVSLALPFAILVGCSEPGPAEKAGERVDDAVENVKDAVNPPGPAERAGREIDDTVDNMKEKN